MARTKQSARRVDRAPKTPMPPINKNKQEEPAALAALREKKIAAVETTRDRMRAVAELDKYQVRKDKIFDEGGLNAEIERVCDTAARHDLDAHPDVSEDFLNFTRGAFDGKIAAAWREALCEGAEVAAAAARDELMLAEDDAATPSMDLAAFEERVQAKSARFGHAMSAHMNFGCLDYHKLRMWGENSLWDVCHGGGPFLESPGGGRADVAMRRAFMAKLFDNFNARLEEVWETSARQAVEEMVDDRKRAERKKAEASVG